MSPCVTSGTRSAAEKRPALSGNFLAAQRAEQDGNTKQEEVSKVWQREVTNEALTEGRNWQS